MFFDLYLLFAIEAYVPGKKMDDKMLAVSTANFPLPFFLLKKLSVHSTRLGWELMIVYSFLLLVSEKRLMR